MIDYDAAENACQEDGGHCSCVSDYPCCYCGYQEEEEAK